jgi:hypothetical protein
MVAEAVHTPPEPRVQQQFGLMLLPVHFVLRIGPTLVDGNSLRHALAANPLGQEALGGVVVPSDEQQEVNCPASLIDRPVQLFPQLPDECRFATESLIALSAVGSVANFHLGTNF